MSDLKLFELKNKKAKPIKGKTLQLEREVQEICESNLEIFFGIKFLATEFSTGAKHGGRIDTLGIDENNCPVIIEYKLNSNENVINQGLFYLDWLMDHQAELKLLVIDKLKIEGNEIDWDNPRLICIASDFNKYDSHAISQINRNIELIRYKKFENEQILFEIFATNYQQNKNNKKRAISSSETVQYYKFQNLNKELTDLYTELDSYILDLGDDIQKKELKFYLAYSKIQNFVCIQFYPQKQEVRLYLKLDYDDLKNPPKFFKNAKNKGHYGTGDTEVSIKSLEDINITIPYIKMAYENT